MRKTALMQKIAAAAACLCVAVSAAAETYPGAELSFGARHRASLNGDWQFLTGADIAYNAYRGERFDSSYISVFAGPQWYTPLRDVALLLRWRNFFDENHQHERHEPEFLLFGGHRFLDRRLALSALVSGRLIEYCSSCSPGGSGTGAKAFLRARLKFSPLVSAEAAVGFTRDSTKKSTLRSRSLPMDAGFIFTLPDDWKAIVNYRHERERFDATDRENTLRSIRFSISSRQNKILGFSPQWSLVHERRTANYASDNYQRLRMGLRFVYEFNN